MAINPIQFLLADVATATNGSTTISIQGTTLANTNASTVFSGSAVFVGDSQVVEGVSGTAFDPATNTSTITLRNAWPHATATGRLVVFNTIEGLANAIQRIREATADAATMQAAFGDVLTATTPTIDVTIDGVVTPITPYGYLEAQTTALLATATTVVGDITAVEDRVDIVENDLSAIEGTLNGLVTSAQDAEAAAELAETNINESLVTFNSDFASFNTDFGTFTTNFSTFTTNFATFDTNFATFSSDFSTFATDYAQFVLDFATIAGSVSEAGTSETNAAASALASQSASSISQANANYVGDWADQTGALNIPSSARHNNAVWQLAVNLADVTLSEPSGANTDWFLIGVIGGIAPDSDRLGNELPSFYATASSIANLVPDTRTINGNALTSNITLTASGIGADTVEVLENPSTQTLARNARKTILNVISGSNIFTVDSSLYSQGDQIEVSKLRQDTPTITTTLDEDNIIFPDGTTDSNVTQELAPTFTITITKRSDGDWDLTVRN